MIISCPLALAQMFESMKSRAAFKIRSEVSMNSSADLERPHLWQKGKGQQRVSLNKQPGTGAAIQRCFARKAH